MGVARTTVSHGARDKLDLVTRAKKIRGQLMSVERALNAEAACVDVLQRLAVACGAINSLMAELMEDHILGHMTGKKNAVVEEDAAADLIEIVRSQLR